SIARKDPSAIVVQPIGQQPSWAVALADDLHHAASQLREFLWQFGPTLDSTSKKYRTHVGTLSILYTFLASNSNGGLEALIERIAVTFPKANQASKLKESLLGSAASRSKYASEFAEAEVLGQLVRKW